MTRLNLSGTIERHTEKGTILPLVAIGMTTLVGFMGLAMDVGALYNHRRVMQTAADAGALAGASEIYRSQTSLIAPSARTATAENRFTDGSEGVTITVNHPPASGFYAGNPQYVEVLIGQPSPTYFMQIFGWSSVQVPARAVAGVGANGKNCIYVLDPSMPDAFEINSSADMSAECGIVVNSNDPTAMHLTSSASVVATSISITGGYSQEGGTLSPTPVVGVPPEPDPLGYLQPPPAGGACMQTNFELVNDQIQTLSPGVYCGGIRLEGNSVATLNSGVYILRGGRIGSSLDDGSLHMTSNARIQGSGVMFYITQGGGYPYRPIVMESSTRAELTAPTGGDQKGILFFQDRSVGAFDPAGQPWQNNLESSSVSSFEGTLYFPTQVLFIESSTITEVSYTIVVARSFVMDSSASFSVRDDYSGLTGGSPIKRISLVE